ASSLIIPGNNVDAREDKHEHARVSLSDPHQRVNLDRVPCVRRSKRSNIRRIPALLFLVHALVRVPRTRTDTPTQPTHLQEADLAVKRRLYFFRELLGEHD
ncbi:unnamed protein product, partial [Ectocarpus sp. 8 AP-2014]